MVSTTKINSSLPVNSLKTASTKVKKNTDKFNAKQSGQTAPTGETYQTFSVSGLSALFLDDAPKQNHHQVITYGNELLDQLEKIHADLVRGTISKEDLIQLVKLLHDRPALTVDPELENLILEIETRAAVELAKLGA